MPGSLIENAMADKFERYQKAEFDRFFASLEFADDTALRIEFETLLGFIGDLHGKRVLDLGCGTGRNGLRLAPYAKEVVGYDLSDVGVAKANSEARRLGLSNFHAKVNN